MKHGVEFSAKEAWNKWQEEKNANPKQTHAARSGNSGT
jgi:hypothetical protein